MPEDNQSGVKNVSLSLDDLQALDPKVLKQLNEKHGIELSVRSSKAAIDGILGSLGRDVGAAAEYTRGFDRTSDMYSKYFDRDTAMTNPADLVTNPIENLSKMSLADALKRLSLDDLARLKGGMR